MNCLYQIRSQTLPVRERNPAAWWEVTGPALATIARINEYSSIELA